MMTTDFKDLLRAFNANGVKYLIIGGHALGVHLIPRTTKDLDLFILSDENNARAAYRALAQFGAPMEGVSHADFTVGTTFQIGKGPDLIDIPQRIDGVTIGEAWDNRIEGVIDGEFELRLSQRTT